MTTSGVFQQDQNYLESEVWDYLIKNRKTNKVKMGFWKAETVDDLIKAGILKW